MKNSTVLVLFILIFLYLIFALPVLSLKDSFQSEKESRFSTPYSSDYSEETL